MFVDFNKVFGKTPQTELKIPQALIDQLSSKLPDGFIYVCLLYTSEAADD